MCRRSYIVWRGVVRKRGADIPLVARLSVLFDALIFLRMRRSSNIGGLRVRDVVDRNNESVMLVAGLRFNKSRPDSDR